MNLIKATLIVFAVFVWICAGISLTQAAVTPTADNITLDIQCANERWGRGKCPEGQEVSIAQGGTMLADFDAGWTMNTGSQRAEHTDGVWNTLDTGHADQTMSIVSGGVSGNALKIEATAFGSDGMYKHYFAYEESHDLTLDAPKTHNRMVMYAKIPEASNDGSVVHTFHVGTYSENPASSTGSSLGNHWYHYYEFRGTDQYWMKIYVDERPQHVVSNSNTVETNPTLASGFNYFDGLTRMYLQMRYGPFDDSDVTPYSVYVDEIEFYTESRDENEFSINSVVVSYFGAGAFVLDWASWSPYEERVETFEVRYSTSPIDTLTDWDNATTIPAMPAGGWGIEHVTHHENHIRASFTIPGMSNTDTYYFAIQDLYVTHTKNLKRVDYNVTAINGAQ